MGYIYETDWDHLVHNTVMAYIFFLKQLQEKVHSFSCMDWDAYLPTLHNLLQPKYVI